jgi:hypothetical protein
MTNSSMTSLRRSRSWNPTGETRGPTPDPRHERTDRLERGTIDRSALDRDELAVAAITIAEYRVGIELADSAESARHARALTAIESVVDVLAYTDTTAAHQPA